MKLTKHFKDNWRERVGGEVTVEEMVSILRESVIVQWGSMFKKSDGQTFKTMKIYWHPGRQVVIKMDPFGNRAVTVLSIKNYHHKNRKRKNGRTVL